MQRVGIIGMGALGTLFADFFRSVLPKEDLSCIVDEVRKKRYMAEGIFCNGARCDVKYCSPDDAQTVDLLLFAVKFHALPAAMESASAFVGEETVILSLLNGISSEEILAERFGSERVLYATAQGMDAVKEGNRVRFTNRGSITFGRKQKGIIDETMRRVDAFFTQCGLPHTMTDRMWDLMWGKFMLNCGVNQACAVYQCGYGGIQNDSEARQKMQEAMREVMALAPYENALITQEDFDQWISIVDGLDPDGMPSLRQDTANRRRSELDLFSGTVIELGRRHKVAVPVNRSFYDTIHAWEAQYVTP